MDTDFSALALFLNPEKLILAGFIIIVALAFSRVVTKTLDRLGEGQARRRLLLKRISSITRFVVFILAGVLIITNIFTLSDEALLALGGTIAVTVGFALKDTAASVISGFLILIDQPFQVGDWIEFGGYYGEVKEIGLRSVRIVTLDDNLVSIPTNKFLTDSVASGNAGELDMMVVMDFHIASTADFAQAKQLAYEATVTSKYVFLNKPVTILLGEAVNEFTFATRVRIKAYVADARFQSRFTSDVTERVMRAFSAERIEGPYRLSRQVDPPQP